MAIKVNYLSLINIDVVNIGQIDFFDNYILPSKDFPYFFLDQIGITVSYVNWPELVPFFYTQKIKTISTDKIATENFLVYSFTATTGTVTLNFTNTESVNVLRALLEDRNSYYLENNNYIGWKKTFTPTSDITNGSQTFFVANQNYYIDSVTVNENNNTGTIIATSTNLTNVSSVYVLSNKNIEFGLYRIPGQTASQSIYYSGIKGRYLCNNNLNILLGGLKIKSQIIGHTHEHIHNMNNHTHTMQHSHGLNGHSHYMSHAHRYTDTRSGGQSLGLHAFPNASPFGGPYGTGRVTSSGRDSTDGPSTNSTSDATVSITTTPSNNITSDVLSKTTDIDDIYSNNNNLKINNKIIPETYTVYPYVYGKTYNT